MSNKYMIVSVHDVTPRFEKEITKIANDLDKIIEDYSILVIPNYENKFNLSNYNSFLNWLKEEKKDIGIHGYNHQGNPEKIKTLKDKLYSDFRYRGETEFYNLDKKEIEEKINNALEIFDKSNLKYSGFVSPCWTMDENLKETLKKNNFDYYTRRDKIHYFEPTDEFDINSRVIQYTARSPIFTLAAIPYNVLTKMTTNQNVIRIPIHPENLKNEKVYFDCLNAIEKNLENGYLAISYKNLKSICKKENLSS